MLDEAIFVFIQKSMYIDYIQDFLRLTKENTKSTRYTSDVTIHIAAKPA